LVTGLGVHWDKEMSDKIQGWINDSDSNQNGTIDFGEFCLVISKMWAANLHDIRGAARHLLVKDRTVSLQSVHGTYLAANKEGEVYASKMEAGASETFVLKRNANGNICLQSRFGKFMVVIDSEDFRVDCNGDIGTQFKMTTLEDERITLTPASKAEMGGSLFVRDNGTVAVSDGNPADIPYTMFAVVSHEELHKKCWSKSTVRTCPQTSIAEARKRSKEFGTPRLAEGGDLLSPGMEKAIYDMDAALDNNVLSARGGGVAVR